MNATTQGILRHFLTIGAGALASRGAINASEIEILVASVLGIGGILWSIVDKKKQAKKLRALPIDE